jgi:hypothetical protein
MAPLTRAPYGIPMALRDLQPPISALGKLGTPRHLDTSAGASAAKAAKAADAAYRGRPMRDDVVCDGIRLQQVFAYFRDCGFSSEA